MWVEEIDVRREPGAVVMRHLRDEFSAEMKIRYPDSDADYGPEALPKGMHLPDGGFFVLFDNGNPVGCVGLRRLPERFGEAMRLSKYDIATSAEGKSLYIEESARGGLGAALLMRAILQSAIERGYKRVYGNTGLNQPESLRVLRGFGDFKSEEIPLYDPSNALAAYAFRLDLEGVRL